METRKLGNSDLQITRVDLGAWAIGGRWQWGWGAQDDRDSVAAIRKAVDLGVNWIDTAAVYGLGHSEEVVGRAVKPMGSGILTGKMTPERIASLPEDDWRKRDYNYTEPQLSRNLKIVEAMRAIAERRGVPTAQIAIAWTLRGEAVTAAIVGMRKPEQAEETVGGGGAGVERRRGCGA